MSQINIGVTAEGAVVNPIAGQVALFASATDEVGVKSSTGTVTYFAGISGVKAETFTLTAGMIAAKQVTLTVTPKNEILFVPKNGPAQVEGLDYTVSGQVVSWNGLGLDGILEENDIIVIYY